MIRQTALLVVALALVITPATAATTTTTIDADNPLTDADHISEYEATGVTNASLAQIDLTVTVADDHDDAGLDGFYLDTGTTYLRLDYDETVDRTIRLYLPEAYFAPRVQRSLDPETSGPTASLTPVRENMTAVTIEVDGKTDATYSLSDTAGGVWAARSWAKEHAENATGWEMPTLTGGAAQWQYIDAGTYSTSSPATINGTSLTVQYEADAPDGGTQWLPVSQCNDPADQRVCYLEDTNTTVIMSSDDSPRVRYKHGTDLLSTLESDINDLFQSDDRAGGFFSSLLGGA